ncbi:MAG: DUF4954 family protein, partial [Planctomycetes bacterium]|nr:DUF4954 family protein [Planctomycetota bacterium]
RNEQSKRPPDAWRNLHAEEIEALVKNANAADNWDNILVADQFNPHLIKNCEFYGLVRIGRLEEVYLDYHDLRVPVGLTNSTIISCDIGDSTAVHNVRYLANYILGDNVILENVDEIQCTNHAKFGNGIVKDGEDEDVRIWLDLINESGGRAVMPFDGMLPADAYMWAKYRDDRRLMERLGEMTQRGFDPRRGFYGTIGDGCVIKNCRVIKDVKAGPCVYIKGANKLKNLTINSSSDEATQIGEGVELVNGIIGRGCHIFYGCKAVRFVMGDNSNLKYGARLIHSFLGDNSTVSCCENLNNLIFPSHEQHHNNSFLIASLVMGQSNLAAAATIGSNHNSRAPDGEIQAGRGFWPGLCVSVKHNCRFASFTLLAKGDYPAELDIPLPFSLVSNDDAANCLRIMPAYWWMYNMYALARNTWKFGARDKRRKKLQNIEFDSLAPDTVEEIFAAVAMLDRWAGQAAARRDGRAISERDAGELVEVGRRLLTGRAEDVEGLEILGDRIENSSRKVVIVKPQEARRAYGQMLHYYAVKNLLAYMKANPSATLASMVKALGGKRVRRWVNLGGQIVQRDDLDRIRADIKRGRLSTWPAVHEAYNRLWEKYTIDKQRHAFATLTDLLEVDELTEELWASALDKSVGIQRYIAEQTFVSRKKDDDNPFRCITFETSEEMEAVLGRAEDNSFVKQVRLETEEFAELVAEVKTRQGRPAGAAASGTT